MIFSIINKQSFLYASLIFLLSLIFLSACSNDKEAELNEMTAATESSPAHVEEEVAASESSPMYDAPAPAPAPEPASPPMYDEEVAATKRSPAYAEDLGATESPPMYVEEDAAMSEENGGVYENQQGSNRFDEYKVVLGADETIQIPGIPGELRVWIGSPDHKPVFPERMVEDETTVPALGESATVEPFAPAFKIDPVETQCIKIHPSGSEVRFKLVPEKQGTFEVGANVYLFDSSDCSGSPIPKTAATLKVLVEVDQKEVFFEKVKELWNVLWDKFVEFWAALVAIFFGLILFLIRKKLKKHFGYEDD